MNNMLLRALTGAGYVALIIVCILCGDACFWALTTLFIVLAQYELQNLLGKKTNTPFGARIYDIFMIFIFMFSLYLSLNHGRVLYVFPLVLCLSILLYVPVRIVIAVADKGESPLKSFMSSALSMLYIVFPLSLLYLAYYLSGESIILITFIFIWLNDTGAYLSGISLGKHKMCERLSPKKTWEGFWGGFILCIAAGIVTSYLLQQTSPEMVVTWAVYAALVSVFGTFGDLFESLIKRTVGVKDSGKIIPGHGGILDRIDSLLAVAPITLLFSLIIDIL